MTRVLVAGVVVLAVVAALDAVLGRAPEPETARTTTATGEETPAQSAAALRTMRVAGRLTYTDDSCRLRTLTLPRLTPAARPVTGPDPGCAFSLSSDGTRAASPGAAWAPAGNDVAFCRGRNVGTAAGAEGAFVRRWRGCTPAWRPNGELTLVRGGGIVAVARDCVVRTCETVAVAPDAVGLGARRHLNARHAQPRSLRHVVVDTAWLTDRRVAVLLDIGVAAGDGSSTTDVGDAVVFFEEGRDIAVHSHVDREPLTRIAASPRGRFVAARPNRLLRADGTEVSLPDWLGRVHAIEFAPDERSIAVATAGNVYVFRTWEIELFDRAGRSPRSIAIPIFARDLAWR